MMTISNLASNSLQKDLIKLSTMKKVNSAADDAAGLAISEKLESQINALNQGVNNTADMNNLVKTAEGGLSTINDGLQRVRELSLQAANGTLTDDDRQMIQYEIDGIMQGINDTVQNTSFNNKKLLDGSFSNQNTASNPDGSGMSVSIDSMSLKSLGLEGYNVTGDFDISQLDTAISKVNETRSKLGAISNTFNHTISSNEITALNMAAANSRIVDTDVAKASMEYSKDKVLQDYMIYSLKQNQEQQKNKLSVLY